MGKAYSEDFRLSVLAQLDGGMSKSQAHRTFRVSRSTLDDWLRLREEQGHVRAKPPQRTTRGAISDLDLFGAFATRHRGATLEQMAHAWQQEHGPLLSRNTFSLALQALGWTPKKRVSATANDASPRGRPSTKH